MKKDSEKRLEPYLNDQVTKIGGIPFKMYNIWTVGFPDRILLLPGGRVIFVELKSTGSLPRPIQVVRHEMLRRLGHDVRVIDTKEQIDELINEIQTAYIPEQSH